MLFQLTVINLSKHQDQHAWSAAALPVAARARDLYAMPIGHRTDTRRKAKRPAAYDHPPPR
jgi:hypothetical protein